MFTLLSSAGKFSRAPTAKNIGQQQKQTKTEETRAIKTAAGIFEFFGLVHVFILIPGNESTRSSSQQTEAFDAGHHQLLRFHQYTRQAIRNKLGSIHLPYWPRSWQ